MKWLAAALSVSLTINIFVLGFFVGRAIEGEAMDGQRARGPGPHYTLRMLARHLPADTRGELRRVFRGKREALRPAMEALRGARDRLHELLTAESYDAGAVAEALAAMRRAEAEVKRPVHETVAEALASLDREERRAFVEAVIERRRDPGGDR